MRKFVVGGMVWGGTARTGTVGGPAAGEGRRTGRSARRRKSGLGVVGTGGFGGKGKLDGEGEAAIKGLTGGSGGKRSMNDSRSVDIADDTEIDDRRREGLRRISTISLIWGEDGEDDEDWGLTSFPLLRDASLLVVVSLGERLNRRSTLGSDGEWSSLEEF